MDASPARLPPPDDWGEEVGEEPDEGWPEVSDADDDWPDPVQDGSLPEEPWDPGPDPRPGDLAWLGEDEEPLPEDDFEHEGHPSVLSPGRTLVRFRQPVLVQQLGMVPAEWDTGAPDSVLSGEWEPVGSTVRILVGDHAEYLPLTFPEGEPPAVIVTLEAAGVRFTAHLRLERSGAPLRVAIGRDLLAGRFVVDATES